MFEKGSKGHLTHVSLCFLVKFRYCWGHKKEIRLCCPCFFSLIPWLYWKWPSWWWKKTTAERWASLALCFAVVRIWGATERASEWAKPLKSIRFYLIRVTLMTFTVVSKSGTLPKRVFLGIAIQFGQLGRLFKPSKDMSWENSWGTVC